MDSQPTPDQRDRDVLRLLQERDGVETLVVLRDGQRLTVVNIAWGYDAGDEFSHVTTNISPSEEGRSFDLFFTSEVASILDPSTGATLLADSGS
jgi:hypothetical protein